MRKLLLLSLFFCLLLFSRCSTESTPVYNLTTTALPTEGGTVSPAQGEYDDGTTVQITATPNDEWAFQGWQGDHSGNQNPANVVMNRDKQVTAQFAQRTYPLTISIEGEGSVVEDIIQDKTTDYESGTVVQLTAEAATGWIFVEWLGDVTSSENPVQITVDNPKGVTAVFERREYPLTVNIEGEGTVTEQIVQEKTTDYAFETVVELTANPESGWQFIEWQGDASGTDTSTRVTVNEAKNVTAVFEMKVYDLTVNISGEGSINEHIVNEAGPVVELTAVPDEGWEFVRWQGDLSGSENPQTMLMDVPKVITAVFEIKTFSLSVDINGQGSVSINPDRSEFDFGSTVQLTANPDEDWIFSGWSGDVQSSQRSLEITMDSDKDLTASFEEVDYDLSINTLGEGSVSQQIVQNEGPVVELTASPANGWEFVEWRGDITGSQNPVEITVDSPKEVTAVFERQSFTLSVNTSGEGSVSKNPDQQEYDFNSTVEITANAAEGWDFVGWQGDLSGSQNPAQITMDQAKEVTAVFEVKTFDLTIQTTGNGSVSRTPNRSEYNFGSTVELTANPDDGWVFVEWTGDVSSSENPLSLIMEENMQVTAVFEEVNYDLTINRDGDGSVNQRIVEDEGPVVELTASPANGWRFMEWRGDLTGSQNPAQITVSTPKSVTAVFERISYPLTVNTTGEGTVSRNPNQQEYEFGAKVTLTANPSNGWEFSRWEGDLSGSNSSAEITIDGAKEVTAVFEVETFELSVNTSGQGSVSRRPNQTEFEFNTTVELTATAANGWQFVKWEGDLSTNQNPASITMNADKQVTAVFERQSYALNVNKTGNGTVSKNPDQGEYEFESDVELTATPDDGYQFAGWTGDVTSSQNPITITMDKEKSVTAVFEVETFKLSVDKDGQGSVNIEPEKSDYDFGETVTLTASPADEWEFVQWSGDESSSNHQIEITMNSDKQVTAVFELTTYQLTVDTDGQGSVSKNPDRSAYDSGSSVQLTATPAEGWEFTQWQGDLTGSSNPRSITMDSNKNVTAVFSEIEYSVSVQAVGNGSVSVTPDKSAYSFGEEVTFEANPDEGHLFTSWSGTFSSTNNPYTHEVEGVVDVTAEFELDVASIVYTFSDATITSDGVEKADFSFTNTIPDDVFPIEFRLKDSSGNNATPPFEEDDPPTPLGHNETATYGVSFGTNPLSEDELSNYSVEWDFEYQGVLYTKVKKVGYKDSSSKIIYSQNERVVFIEAY